MGETSLHSPPPQDSVSQDDDFEAGDFIDTGDITLLHNARMTLSDLNERDSDKLTHKDFYNQFGDLFDDNDLN